MTALIILIVMVTSYSLYSTRKRIQLPLELLTEELKDLSLLDDDGSIKINNIIKTRGTKTYGHDCNRTRF